MTKILIVEDDPLMIRLYEKIFERKGYGVVVADRGEKGIELLKSGGIDMVLLDIMMPEMDGFEFLEKIKKDPQTKDVKVIVLSNLAGKDDEQKALDLGASKYVIKSEHDPKEVVDYVQQIIGK